MYMKSPSWGNRPSAGDACLSQDESRGGEYAIEGCSVGIARPFVPFESRQDDFTVAALRRSMKNYRKRIPVCRQSIVPLNGLVANDLRVFASRDTDLHQ
jgi:hypothetical protein